MTEASAAGQANEAAAVPSPRWSVADPVWWIAFIGAVLVTGVVQAALPSGTSEIVRYALSGPLEGVLAGATYWRFRLRAPWSRALGVGILLGGSLLAIGWWKGRF